MYDLRIEIVDRGKDNCAMIVGYRAVDDVLIQYRKELLLQQFPREIHQRQILAVWYRMNVVLLAIKSLRVNCLRQRVQNRNGWWGRLHRREDGPEPLHEVI